MESLKKIFEKYLNDERFKEHLKEFSEGTLNKINQYLQQSEGKDKLHIFRPYSPLPGLLVVEEIGLSNKGYFLGKTIFKEKGNNYLTVTMKGRYSVKDNYSLETSGSYLLRGEVDEEHPFDLVMGKLYKQLGQKDDTFKSVEDIRKELGIPYQKFDSERFEFLKNYVERKK